MGTSIHILFVEDRATDAELAEREIKKVLAACVFQRVETRETYLAALASFQPDLIVSDYHMPQFDGLTALKLALEHTPLTPLIILTSAINEDTAVECMKAGAADYVIKEHIKRLGQAVLHALDEQRLRQERQRAEHALRASEDRFRELYENAPIGLYRITPTGGILMANPAAVRMLGYASFAEFARRDPGRKEAEPAYSRREFYQRLEQVGEITGLESTWMRTDGSTIFVRESARAVRDEHGHVLYYDGTLEDITERRRAEEAQAKLEEQLRQTQKMESIGRLAGGVAHDFNNLLTVIDGYCELIQAQMSDEDSFFQDVKQIRLASDRAAALTRQLLAFSRKQILEPTVLDLNHLVSNLRTLLARLIGEDITLTTILQPELLPVVADTSQVEQVIMNLAVNARDAMPTGGTLTIETRNILLGDPAANTRLGSHSDRCVLLAVSDTGCGMDESTQARIFEPFFTTKDAGKGTGLGLSTVYGIVKQSGGDITVSSIPGQGATFNIYLPASAIVADQLIAPQIPAVSDRGTETILLVEDEEMVCNLVRTVLQAKGYTILEARQGDAALALFEQHQGAIDLLMTDVVMPQMSGRELAERLIALRPRMKVLFISGYTDDTVGRHGLLAADVQFLPKPFSPSMLTSKVREVLDA
jgi:two-component system, cell cycle sensor histidine kinase and response regulator CckA